MCPPKIFKKKEGLAGSMITSWSLVQEVTGSDKTFLQKKNVTDCPDLVKRFGGKAELSYYDKIDKHRDNYVQSHINTYCIHLSSRQITSCSEYCRDIKQRYHGTGKTGKTGNLEVHFSRQGKHREFAKKY